jgi:hypothetical protein
VSDRVLCCQCMAHHNTTEKGSLSAT